MRILIVHNHYRSDAPSGEDSVVQQESAGLRALGHEVKLFERFSDDIVAMNPARKALAATNALTGVTSRRPFREALHTFRPDVVHVHNLFPLVSPSVFGECVRARVPVVATLHNYKLLCARGDMYRDDAPCSECGTGTVRPALRHRCYHGSLLQTVPVVAGIMRYRSSWQTMVSAYIAISQAQMTQLGAVGLPESRVFVKPNFVPSTREPSEDRDVQVAYIGRLEEAKGVRVLMSAWEQFQATALGSALRLAIAGGGPLDDEVRAWAAKQPSVDVYGLLPRDAAMDVVARSRCTILPSLWFETFGLVAVESMALAVPPVAASHGSFPEIVTPGANGLLFDSRDPAALAAILHDVDRQPERFRQLGLVARRTYEEVFAPGPNLARLLDIYAFAVANPVTASMAHLG